MKSRKLLTAIAFIFIIFSLSACKNGDNSDNNNADTLRVEENINIDTTKNAENQSETVEDDNDFTAKYVCPMHCQGSGSNEAGNCKVCGMELIENLDFKY